jgi:hypothetical protein
MTYMVVQVASVLAILAAGVAAVVYLAKVVAKTAASVRRAVHLVDDLLGEPAHGDQPERPGVLGQLAALREQLACMDLRLITVEREMSPNGGASIRDRVEAIAAATTEPPP